jgi:serine/threonine protein kinase
MSSVPELPSSLALLAGRYRLGRELGRGASGRVLLAHDTADRDAPRALKVVPAARAERLRWELSALAAIAHPSVVRVHELLTVDARGAPLLRVPAGAQVLVESIRVHGRQLQPDRVYSLTVNEAVLMFLPLLGITAQDPQVLPDVGFEAVRDLVHARGVLLPWPEGRICDVGVPRKH